MCGITGYVTFDSATELDDIIISRMINTLHHRGPDYQDYTIEIIDDIEIGLGHARLSIIDLSNEANQPMQYEQFTLVYNGEVYNYREIKVELIKLGHNFKTNSDTEVILHAYKEWGEKCVNHFVGMFAFVLYDKDINKIFIARDRAGVKPLYYTLQNNIFLFGSELKSLLEHPIFRPSLNYQALHSYFSFNNIAAPQTIYRNVYKFPAGHTGFFDLKSKELTLNKYWSVFDYYAKEKAIAPTYKEAKEKTKDLLIKSVNYRNIADVPVGVFLSGGIDSSTIAAIMQNHTEANVKTFTIGFDTGNNEAPFAKEIAKFLDTEHHEHYMTCEDAKEIIEQIPYYYDEPFADSSAIPTTFVSKLVSKHVKVVQSADGGDELFFGYDDYNNIDQYAKRIGLVSKIPKPIRLMLANGINLFNNINNTTSFKARKFDGFKTVLKSNRNNIEATLFEEYSKSSGVLIRKLLKCKHNSNKLLTNPLEVDIKDSMSLFIANDYKFYLQNDMLHKIDRATMSCSIEGREPLMDHNLLEYVASLPTKYKYCDGNKKIILKDILYDYIPKEMMDRPKSGFTVPIYEWLRKDLNYLIKDYLSKEKLELTKAFNVDYALKLIKLFEKKNLSDETIIWKMLMFQMWYFQWEHKFIK